MPLKTLTTLLRVVREQGYPVEQALLHIGLEFNPLEDDPASLPTQIPTDCYSRLYGLLMELLQDEAFGLGQEYHSPPGTFRMMCLFVIHCPTLEQALRRAREFYDYCDQFRDSEHHDGPLFVPQGESGNVLCVLERGSPSQQNRAHIGHANVLLMMFRFYSWLIGRELPLQEVRVRANEPAQSQPYEAIFGCPVRFGTDHSGLVMSNNVLQLPIVQTEDSLREFLRQAPYHLVKRETPGSLNPLTQKIKQLLTEHSNQKLPNASEIALTLNMSPRTLHRKLTSEGTSFQQLKDDFRRELAVHYMNRPELTLDAIAAVMGFQDNSAFYRSFKKWTGVSPGRYRATMLAGEANP
ncbi:AraC family transcriptional regulator [Halioglobus maricola]|nr:AraC family transcriptional regulator [Halioglobus maricola]